MRIYHPAPAPPDDAALLATLDRCAALLPADAVADRANLASLRVSVEVRQYVREAARLLRPRRLKARTQLGTPQRWELN